ncbi:MAG TPA: MFS transporter, partial [Beutenbergiaceae bacterium]|nr:MFS transporter [Beutenbergiaceae bacterium]
MTGDAKGSQDRLWTTPFVAAVLVNLFMSSVFYLLLTSMAGYAIERFQASDAAAGFASAGFI